jgi:hypothetical protein
MVNANADYQKIFSELENKIKEDLSDNQIKTDALQALRSLAILVYMGLRRNPTIIARMDKGKIIYEEKP